MCPVGSYAGHQCYNDAPCPFILCVVTQNKLELVEQSKHTAAHGAVSKLGHLPDERKMWCNCPSPSASWVDVKSSQSSVLPSVHF